jgi:hypothetical protein
VPPMTTILIVNLLVRCLKPRLMIVVGRNAADMP